MQMASLLGSAVLLSVEILLTGIVGYWIVLTIAALFVARRTPDRPSDPTTRFVILVPAYNEEQSLPQTLASIRSLDYPASLVAVHVVADNCSDRTAETARASGATVHERFDKERRGKGYALDWVLRRLEERTEAYDACVVVDADSVLSANFLQIMDVRLFRGERVIQGYYAVRNPERSWSTALRAVALALRHYLRPLGRMGLRGSAGMMGNGMAIAKMVASQHSWGGSLTEDVAYHAALVLAGERVTFAPDAVVYGDMPESLKTARSQNERWEAGRWEVMRHYGLPLVCEAFRRHSFVTLETAADLLLPPLSVVAGAAVACLLGAVIAGTPFLTGWALVIVTAIAVHVLCGLILARAPMTLYRALVFAPVLVLWKLALWVRLVFGRRPETWVRTTRTPER